MMRAYPTKEEIAVYAVQAGIARATATAYLIREWRMGALICLHERVQARTITDHQFQVSLLGIHERDLLGVE